MIGAFKTRALAQSPRGRSCTFRWNLYQLRRVTVETDERFRSVNVQRQRKMGVADKQIRVSEAVKREIERRRREGESYNDVLERMFSARPSTDRDLFAGFGILSDEEIDRVRENINRSRKKSKERMRRLDIE